MACMGRHVSCALRRTHHRHRDLVRARMEASHGEDGNPRGLGSHERHNEIQLVSGIDQGRKEPFQCMMVANR